ncbi:hypothetical protein AJ80_04398 [Polytolypa hystricis UAMH7299]|uniref:Uncharacterized protein n=1 Tax=Polytolypa hystricis (strain UAMH7299) TaxID=1447883 RepID=A0A2B7YC65_POLH7|nr:hypothetical protein AJ80_04398 [Polytolypa hystricis UAMH7299]
MSTTKYSQGVPEGAIVAPNREALNAIVEANPETILHDRDGGFHLLDMEGNVVAVAADELIPELQASFDEADKIIAKEKEEEEKKRDKAEAGDNTPEKEKEEETTKRAEAGLAADQACAHRRCFNSIICVTYKDCHICSSRNICI